MLNKLARCLSVAVVLASTLTLQGCLESEQEMKAKQAAQQKAIAAANYEKALRQRQCEFIGKTATDNGNCVDKK